MGAGASVQSLPATHVKAATEADVACVVSDLSAEERQKLQKALAMLEGEGSREPKTSPYPSLLGSTRLPQLDAGMSKGGYSKHPNVDMRQ
ncbi:unnamed protein product [Symbiodinium pilosum]|uniref:Uncharacterized protein n=1 Tax=Symbiodinium pilosum TaxID=2952 RepID=A0A812VVU3_SYMPI|nr:unnamed protein product [Symbiodinium pilosum]